MTLGLGSFTALSVLFAFFIARPPTHEDTRGESLGDRALQSLVSFEGPVVTPVVNNVAQWFGLCSAYAATTVAGFKTQVMSDPQLMEHYKDFEWQNAMLIENSEDFYSSVLYKKNGQFYWTRKLLRIRKGEKVLTDGKMQIRTYCCNQIAIAPPGPFLPPLDEPPPEDLQPPEAPATPDLPPIDIPPQLLTFLPPFTPPAVMRPRFFGEKPPRRAPTRVPEPATVVLLLSGLGALVLSHRRWTK